MNDTPDKAPTPKPERKPFFDTCDQSRYGTHKFDADGWTRCSRCGRAMTDCIVKPDAS
jgi:hypothetical protein